MIYKLLGGTPDDALNGTTVLDTISLLKGADILRVHDVWMLVSVGSSNEVYVSAMGGFARSLKLTLAVTLLAFLGLFQTLALAGGSPYWTLAYAAALALSGSCVLRQIYFGQSRADERVMALLKNPNIVYNSLASCLADRVTSYFPSIGFTL